MDWQYAISINTLTPWLLAELGSLRIRSAKLCGGASGSGTSQLRGPGPSYILHPAFIARLATEPSDR